MKGIILAGGKGVRLYPLTKVTNKHLLPVGRQPMIFNPIQKLVQAGIEDILIVTSTEQMGSIVNLLAGGSEFGCRLTYRVQEAPLGTADALRLAEDFAGNDKIVVVIGDNITTGSLKPFVEQFAEHDGAMVLLKRVDDSLRHAIATLDGSLVKVIEEQPSTAQSNIAVIGYYFYDPSVFGIIKGLLPSKRGEYEITDVNNEYIRRSKLMAHFLDAPWTDAGTFESLLYANQMMLATSKPSRDTGKVSEEQLREMIGIFEDKIASLKRYFEK